MTFADAARLNVPAVRCPSWPPGCYVEIRRGVFHGYVGGRWEWSATLDYLTRDGARFDAECVPVTLGGEDGGCGNLKR